ncbi:M3 family oligoendopeptidase [Elusimicrobiota bacterium]
MIKSGFKKEQSIQMKWKLDDIVTLDKFEKLFTKVENSIKSMSDFVDMLDPDISNKDFKRIIYYIESAKIDMSRLAYRAFLMEAEDQKSSQAKLLKSRVKDLDVMFEDSIRKIDFWLMGKKIHGKKILDQKKARRLFASIPDLEYVLKYRRELAVHKLSEEQETIIINKDINGVDTLTDMRTLIETEFEYEFKPRGYARNKKIRTQAELLKNVHSSDKSKRKTAYVALLKKYAANIDKFFLIYQAVVKDWVYEARIRNFNSPISMRNKKNHITDRAIDLLLDVCVKNRKIFWDYFRYKADMLGTGTLSRFDIYAPLKHKKEHIPFDGALQTVLDTFKDFGSGFYKNAKKIVDTSHIHSHPGPAKRTGAFCASVAPGIIPYVLLNYTGTVRDVMTLAHELGHAVHSIYADHHSISSFDANLPLAETASTLAEVIVFNRLLETSTSKAVKRSLLLHKLAESYATIIRQNYFVKFEIQAHKRIPQGITSEGLSEIYMENISEQFEDSVMVDKLFRYEWAYIPHIVNTPFYCYAYNFGELLSLSLYSQYMKKGKQFVGAIETILAYGGSKQPVEILGEVGIDIESRRFWQNSFTVIENWLNQLKRL